jgi:hypothetical protein
MGGWFKVHPIIAGIIGVINLYGCTEGNPKKLNFEFDS